jgi:hypothetical protein
MVGPVFVMVVPARTPKVDVEPKVQGNEADTVAGVGAVQLSVGVTAGLATTTWRLFTGICSSRVNGPAVVSVTVILQEAPDVKEDEQTPITSFVD